MNIDQAILAAFVSVRGERPNAATIRSTNEEPMPWDSDLADFRKMLKALEQEGYRVVPMEPTREMLNAGLILKGEYMAAIAAAPEIEI